ncbi:hypothetical protein BOTBODRAFT_32195 [Botryobasidium botryosum FD-172 SS1]|uniref:DUF410-domain-containing protein n=1 Tax=Botryobasidium botryosum (strain FD-172 SS1) TaxID=930990 RepID=A0A067MGD7_BOTB1|nr:hypothetical protein BOTBODRAFT_32195 [Botryobasidium botryosum FD-172 SS1]
MATANSPERALKAILPLIEAGQAYEAHQKARTFASRYVKASQFDTAIQVLFQSARELLKAGHLGSGTDLGLFLIDVYNTKEQAVDEESRGRLTQLIALTGPSGTWRKTLIDKSVAWSSTLGWCPSGDPDLQHYIGELLYKEGAFDLAEPHLLAAGERDSARLLATIMFEWSRGGAEPGAYASRGVIPYLILTNILAARTFLAQFLSHLQIARPALFTQPSAPLTIGDTADEIYPTTDPTLNFLQLAIRTCQRGNGRTAEHQRDARNAWVRLCGRYVSRGAGAVGSQAMKEAAAALGKEYFGIQPARSQVNPLQEMMSSFFGGGAPAPAALPSTPRIAGGGRGRGRLGAAPGSPSALD